MKMLDALLGAFSFQTYQKALRQRREDRRADYQRIAAERDEMRRKGVLRQHPGQG
jgi:hypothetical protein